MLLRLDAAGLLEEDAGHGLGGCRLLHALGQQRGIQLQKRCEPYLCQQRVEVVVVDDSHTATGRLITSPRACGNHAHLDDEKTFPRLNRLAAPQHSPGFSPPLLASSARSRHRVTPAGELRARPLPCTENLPGFPSTHNYDVSPRRGHAHSPIRFICVTKWSKFGSSNFQFKPN